jgi:hypothetical protein
MIKRLILLAAAALACAAQAGPVEVQKIRLGMTQQEFASAYPKGVDTGFSVGGATSRRGFAPAAVQFRDGGLEQFSAYFEDRDFDAVMRAVVAKNPSVKCNIAQGVSVCYEPEGTFILSRSAGATMLLLQSQRITAEAERAFLDPQTTAIQAGRTGM